MLRVLVVAVLALGFALLGGCGGAVRTVGGVPQVEVPASADTYSTDARSGGVRGGGTASDAEELLEKHLAARGDDAEADGALADTAAWFLRRAYRQQDISSPSIGQEVAIRFGFGGMYYGTMAGSLAKDERWIEQLVGQVPKNSVINRYGIVAGQGRDVAVVIGAVEVSLDDFPRSVAPGASLRLKGEATKPYQRVSVFSTNPDGKVKEIPMTARAIDTSVPFRETGVHKLEIMGYGKHGPAVLLNVPIHVGVAPAEGEAAGAEADPNLTVEEAEAAMLSLLNEERAKRGLGKVEADAELRAVALAHSVDMIENHFASHISPTTGGPDHRITKAKIRVSTAGECIAIHSSPAGAHRGLLDSPAHRATMLSPDYTHVGVGVSFHEAPEVGRRLTATLLFGRRPPTDDTVLTAAEIVELINATRRAHKLPTLQVDQAQTAAAGAGARALAAGTVKNGPDAVTVAGRALTAAGNRGRAGGVACQTFLEMIDRYQLTQMPFFRKKELRTIGVGTALVESEIGKRLAVIMISDAGVGKALKSCE